MNPKSSKNRNSYTMPKELGVNHKLFFSIYIHMRDSKGQYNHVVAP